MKTKYTNTELLKIMRVLKREKPINATHMRTVLERLFRSTPTDKQVHEAREILIIKHASKDLFDLRVMCSNALGNRESAYQEACLDVYFENKFPNE